MAISAVDDSQTFSYTGGMQSFTAPFRGVCKLDDWRILEQEHQRAREDHLYRQGRAAHRVQRDEDSKTDIQRYGGYKLDL